MLCSLCLAAATAAQVPPAAPAVIAHLAERGRELVEREDPVAALDVFRELRARAGEDVDAMVGLGSAHLLLGRAELALRYADAALRRRPDDGRAVALRVRALLRARRFAAAVAASAAAVAELPESVDVLAAHASALFRAQRNDEAAAAYRRVVALDPLHAEAHLRLGSGLSEPSPVRPPAALADAVELAHAGDLEGALDVLLGALRGGGGHPVAHRLLGEALFAQRAADSMASSAVEFRWLRDALPAVALDDGLAADFLPAYGALDGGRREVARRALALFTAQLPKLVAIGGRHDLLLELERTTDSPSRAALRGRRTFDGRVWDDVRGVGGLRAATGIEALDEAWHHGFDTLAHEVAHQAHLYGTLPKRRILVLYKRALAAGRCLDFYAASNDAEYFGQGVEAFASYGKRPGWEATHGHTRFELMRVDPELHDLIARHVSHDPLGPQADPRRRAQLLRASIAVALRSGRPADAVTAAELLPPGTERDALLTTARRAELLAGSH